ncbi:hypothetical protein sos41_20140 [Alphaproteobacteria bacterium SO-S41]|nr:hypothetical protein sos41_20140 [Alphaproteobacteria bacterium SO-S41]
MTGEISFIELGSGAPVRTRTFFSELFGWPFTPMQGDNGCFQTPTVRAGLHGDDPGGLITVFFRVADLAAAVARVRDIGGESEDPGPPQPGFGRFAMCRDPQGLHFGLHEV